MELQTRLNQLKERIESQMSPEVLGIMHEATQNLSASGIGEKILKVGDNAPVFSLPNQAGLSVSSTDLLKKGPLLITFYRGVWCPYCNVDLSFLKRYKETIESYGVSLLSISPQLPNYSTEIIKQQGLNFDLLSDSNNSVAHQFGLRWELVDPLKSLYRDQFNIKLPKYNGDDSWTLPIPARFIIGQDGRIKYAEYAIDYTQRPDPKNLVAIIKSL